jgi:hypothetical protein
MVRLFAQDFVTIRGALIDELQHVRLGEDHGTRGTGFLPFEQGAAQQRQVLERNLMLECKGDIGGHRIFRARTVVVDPLESVVPRIVFLVESREDEFHGVPCFPLNCGGRT